MTTMTETDRRRSTRCSSGRRPEAIWDAITKPEFTERYFYGARSEFDLRPGGSSGAGREDAALVDGEVLEADPPRRLVHTWRVL